ncbi:MAG TPA: YihY/virulence factor BrkB family protein [Vicinamibacterales bacterium]
MAARRSVTTAAVVRRGLRAFRREARLIWPAAWTALVQFAGSDNLTYAASIAYFALLSLFPCLMLAVALLGHFSADASARLQIISFVLRYLPTQFHFIVEQLNRFERTTITLGVTGTVALIWAALGVFGAVSTAVNYAWGVPQRSVLRHRLLSFIMLFAAALLMLAALVIVSVGTLVQGNGPIALVARFPGLMFMAGLAFRHAPTLLLIMVVGMIYYFVPNGRVRFRDIWLGAIVTGLGWRVALWGFSLYVERLAGWSVNGSIGAVVVFLFWVYISAVVLLYGTQFTAAHARLRLGLSQSAPAAPVIRE